MDPADGVLDASPASPAEALPDFGKYSTSELADYLKTGEFSKEKTTSDAAPESGQTTETAASGGASDASTKETKQDPPKPNREERRNQKLNNENRDLRARLEALEKAQSEKRETRPDASTTTLKKPRIADYESTTEGTAKWEDDLEAYFDAKTDARLAKEREANQQEKQQAESKKSVDSMAKTFGERAVAYRKTLTEDTFAEDFTEINNYIKANDLGYLADALVESEVGPQFFTYFGEHFDEFEKLAAMTPTAALREFGRLEVSEKIKGPAPKTRTAAKKIGSEVRGSTAVTDEDDQLEEAARTGNMKLYDRIMSKREAAETRR